MSRVMSPREALWDQALARGWEAKVRGENEGWCSSSGRTGQGWTMGWGRCELWDRRRPWELPWGHRMGRTRCGVLGHKPSPQRHHEALNLGDLAR